MPLLCIGKPQIMKNILNYIEIRIRDFFLGVLPINYKTNINLLPFVVIYLCMFKQIQ